MKAYLKLLSLIFTCVSQLTLSSCLLPSDCPSIGDAKRCERASQLKFREDKTFKIVAFGDVHWDGNTVEDMQTLSVMETILAEERPDFVIYLGDNCSSVSGDMNAIVEGYRQLTAPVVTSGIPWAVALGNHDIEEALQRKEIYRAILALPGNLSQMGPGTIHGYSNYILPVMDSTGTKTTALLYVLDSNTRFYNAYFDEEEMGWIRPDQVLWYCDMSTAYRQANNGRLPSYMFFHIPLPEIDRYFAEGITTGVNSEPSDASRVNGGLWSALFERQDIKGVFFGHAHANDFISGLDDIWMGYVQCVSYHAYGRADNPKGARVILLKEGVEAFDTWLRLENHQIVNRIHCGTTSLPVLRGQWDFEQGNLGATVGNDLEFAKDDVKAATRFGTTTQFDIPGIAGDEALVMQVPELNPMNGYIMRHGDLGKRKKVNKYTLIFDLLYPSASNGKWRVLLQTDPSNASDGDFFFNETGGLGVRGDYPGHIQSNTWYRVALVVDLTVPKVTKFINGQKLGEQALDSRWSLRSVATDPGAYALLFADDNGENSLTYVNSIQYWSGCLPDKALIALGAPTAEGLPVPTESNNTAPHSIGMNLKKAFEYPIMNTEYPITK